MFFSCRGCGAFLCCFFYHRPLQKCEGLRGGLCFLGHASQCYSQTMPLLPAQCSVCDHTIPITTQVIRLQDILHCRAYPCGWLVHFPSLVSNLAFPHITKQLQMGESRSKTLYPENKIVLSCWATLVLWSSPLDKPEDMGYVQANATTAAKSLFRALLDFFFVFAPFFICWRPCVSTQWKVQITVCHVLPVW